jgi:hypothetical protein
MICLLCFHVIYLYFTGSYTMSHNRHFHSTYPHHFDYLSHSTSLSSSLHSDLHHTDNQSGYSNSSLPFPSPSDNSSHHRSHYLSHTISSSSSHFDRYYTDNQLGYSNSTLQFPHHLDNSSHSRSVYISNTLSSSSFHSTRYYSDNPSISSNSLLQFPSNSENSSLITHPRDTDPLYHHIAQPQSNPQTHFLNRSSENCPKHLTGSKRTKWLKTGEKARKNQDLLSNNIPFHWSTVHYHAPIHIHHRTPSNIIENLIRKLSIVHNFTIDTESDKCTKHQPKPIPALIQIQAIHNENSATVLLIEVQHLPHPTTLLFSNNFTYSIFL